MSKMLKNIIATLAVIIVFSTSCLVCFAANGPGYTVKYYDGLCVGINCKVIKDQDVYPYYKYDQCAVRLIEGNYNSGWKYSAKFSKEKSSRQQLPAEEKRLNNLFAVSYARYRLIGKN